MRNKSMILHQTGVTLTVKFIIPYTLSYILMYDIVVAVINSICLRYFENMYILIAFIDSSFESLVICYFT